MWKLDGDTRGVTITVEQVAAGEVQVFAVALIASGGEAAVVVHQLPVLAGIGGELEAHKAGA